MSTRGTLLLVDDLPQNIRLLEAVLAPRGYAIVKAESGREALGRLRSDPATAGVRVLALTAFAMKDDRERFLAAGFDGYLEKPLDVRRLPEQVAAALAADEPTEGAA